MAQSVPLSGSSTATYVFTASAAGLYLLHTTAGVLFINDVDNRGPINQTEPGNGDHLTWFAYLNSGDEVFHYGPAASVSGVRLGDEL